MCMLSNYAIQYLLTLFIHIHLVRLKIIVSVRKNKQTYFFNPNGMCKDKPTILFFFLYIFTFAAFVLTTSLKHLLTYGDVIRYFYDRKMHKKRGWMFFFSLVRNRRTIDSLQCIFQTSLHAPIMLLEPDEPFFSCYHSLSLFIFSLIFYLM